MKCPGGAILLKAAERGASDVAARGGRRWGPFSSFLHRGRHAKASRSSSWRSMRMSPPPPTSQSPLSHLYALRTRSLVQRAAPGRGRGAERQVETSGGDLREGKGHQGPTDHYEVENVPEVAEVGTLVQDEPQVDHLGVRRDGARVPRPTWGSSPHPSSLWGEGHQEGTRGGEPSGPPRLTKGSSSLLALRSKPRCPPFTPLCLVPPRGIHQEACQEPAHLLHHPGLSPTTLCPAQYNRLLLALSAPTRPAPPSSASSPARPEGAPGMGRSPVKFLLCPEPSMAPTSLGVKAKVLPVAHKAPPDLSLSPPYSQLSALGSPLSSLTPASSHRCSQHTKRF